MPLVILQKLSALNAKAAELRQRMADFKPKKAALKKKTAGSTAGSVAGETLNPSPKLSLQAITTFACVCVVC